MKDTEALKHLSLDLLSYSKRKNRRLTIALMVSLMLNIVLSMLILDMKIAITDGAEEALIMSTVIAKKPSEHMATKHKLKDICEVKTFEELLERCILTEEEKHILREHYLHGKSLVAISMEMGYAEDTIKHKHQKILKRLHRIM